MDDIAKYIKLGKLGEAFTADEQVVLLIDEIDKADLEFPNDLLWELDRMEFYIPETGETVKAKHRPIVIITSNAEKELPDAFLRRCVFHYIELPGPSSRWKRSSGSTSTDLDESLLPADLGGLLPHPRAWTTSKRSPAPPSWWTGSTPSCSAASPRKKFCRNSPLPAFC